MIKLIEKTLFDFVILYILSAHYERSRERCWMHVTCVCVFAESGGGRVCGGAVHVHASAGISCWTHQHTDHLQRPETSDTRRHQPEMCQQLLLRTAQQSKSSWYHDFMFYLQKRWPWMLIHGRVNCINVCEQLVLCSKWVVLFFLPSVHYFDSFAAMGRFAVACCWGWLADRLTKACKGPTGWVQTK